MTMGLIFVLSWLVQSVAGRSADNEEQLKNFQQPGSWAEYLVSPEFWNRTLQNWAVGVPCRRIHGRPGYLPSPAGLAGIHARGLRA
jgi:hypothetical protein